MNEALSWPCCFMQQDYFSFEYLFVMYSIYLDGRLELLNFRKSIQEKNLKQKFKKSKSFLQGRQEFWEIRDNWAGRIKSQMWSGTSIRRNEIQKGVAYLQSGSPFTLHLTLKRRKQLLDDWCVEKYGEENTKLRVHYLDRKAIIKMWKNDENNFL